MPSEATARPHLEVAVEHRIGNLSLAVNFRSSAPWTTLFGPSGSGKSTILRAIAGVLRPDAGRIVINGQVVFDSAAGVWIPSYKRVVRWAPQRAMLFPHQTVRGNLRTGSNGQTENAQRAIDHFDLSALSHKLPAQLSGGQQQRIGVIRAAASLNERLLLLDEPFTGLDAAVRDAFMDALRTWIAPSPVLSVTHDLGEVFLLNADVVRIAEGRVVAQGAATDVLNEERRRLQTLLASSSA